MTARGVIFDLDGTLAHTLPDIADAVNAGLADFSLPPRDEAEIREWIGEGLPTLCRRAVANDAHVPPESFVAAVTAHYARTRLNKVKPFDGIPEVLDELNARGIPIAVLTNKPHIHTIPLMDAVFSRWTWSAVEGYKEEQYRKPDPRVALRIVAEMKLQPADVLMVGDSFTDMKTGVNAGLTPIGCTWGYRYRHELEEAGAARLIDRPAELLALIAKKY